MQPQIGLLLGSALFAILSASFGDISLLYLKVNFFQILRCFCKAIFCVPESLAFYRKLKITTLMFYLHLNEQKEEKKHTGLPHYNTPHFNTDFNITRSCLGSQMVIFLLF